MGSVSPIPTVFFPEPSAGTFITHTVAFNPTARGAMSATTGVVATAVTCRCLPEWQADFPVRFLGSFNFSPNVVPLPKPPVKPQNLFMHYSTVLFRLLEGSRFFNERLASNGLLMGFTVIRWFLVHTFSSGLSVIRCRCLIHVRGYASSLYSGSRNHVFHLYLGYSTRYHVNLRVRDKGAIVGRVGL